MSRCLLALILPVVFGKITYELLGDAQLKITDFENGCVLFLSLPTGAIPVIENVKTLLEKKSLITPCIDPYSEGIDTNLAVTRPSFGLLAIPVYIQRYVVGDKEKYLTCGLQYGHYSARNRKSIESYFGELAQSGLGKKFFSQYLYVYEKLRKEPKLDKFNPGVFRIGTPNLRFCRVMFHKWRQLKQLVVREQTKPIEPKRLVIERPTMTFTFEYPNSHSIFYYLTIQMRDACSLKIRFDALEKWSGREGQIVDRIAAAAAAHHEPFKPCDFTRCVMDMEGYKQPPLEERCGSERLSTHVLYNIDPGRWDNVPMQWCVCVESIATAEKLFNLLRPTNSRGYPTHKDFDAVATPSAA
jgi:hypothetical protein